MDFKDIDFQILKFIYENNLVFSYDVINKFPEKDFCTEYRLKLLFENQYITYPVDETEEKFQEGYLIITDLGRKALQDYQYEHTKEIKRRNIDYVWKFAPIIISLISLIKSFYPEIKMCAEMLLRVLYKQ